MLKHPHSLDAARGWVLCVLAGIASPVVSQTAGWYPDAVFVQAGWAQEAHAEVVGAVWSWPWQRRTVSGVLTGYSEMSFGRWSSERNPGQGSSAWVTQLGLTPVLRWSPASVGDAWFVEAGVGANLLLPAFRSRDKRFSTAFNFGDHLAVGWRFGAGLGVSSHHEIALRLQHFSNAGIRQPNPGENFWQLRYTVPL